MTTALSRQTLLEIHRAAIDVHLERIALLRGIPSAFVEAIPITNSAASQILVDIEELNNASTLSDGSCPLMVWLDSAIALSQSRHEAEVFRRARTQLITAVGSHPSNSGSSRSRPTASNGIRGLVDELETRLQEREHSAYYPVRLEQLKKRIDFLSQQIRASKLVQPGVVFACSELIKPIGSGNFGTIWLSRRVETGEMVATKVFHFEKLTQDRMLWHFRRSIRAMERLKKHHYPGIVQIYDVDESGLAFSMEFLSEGNLEDVAQRGWTLKKKLDVTLSTSAAVAHAHHLGIIHRDIKPANIVLNKTHSPILTDFDIADIKFLTRLSTAGGGLGTPMFAAPEQLEDGDNADERADIYSLGRLLYFLLLERAPGLRIEREPSLDNISRYPTPLVAVVRRATMFAPEARYQTVRDFMQALERYETRRASLAAAVRRAVRWGRANFTILITLLLLLAGTVTIALIQTRRAQEQTRLAAQELKARMQAESLQRQLTEVLGQLSKASDDFAKLEREKATVREQLSDAEAKMAVLVEKRDQQRSGSTEWRKYDALITDAEVLLLKLRAEQVRVNSEAQRLKTELDDASRKARTLKAESGGSDSSDPMSKENEPTSSPVPDSTCRPDGFECNNTAHCCPGSVCDYNKCKPCGRIGQWCASAPECCGNLICIGNSCAQPGTLKPTP